MCVVALKKKCFKKWEGNNLNEKKDAHLFKLKIKIEKKGWFFVFYLFRSQCAAAAVTAGRAISSNAYSIQTWWMQSLLSFKMCTEQKGKTNWKEF